MSSDTSTTATGRLAAMCTQFNTVSGTLGLAEAWAQYLSVPASDTHSLVRGIQGVASVIREARAECEVLRPRHRDQMLPIWLNLETLVNVRNWDAEWATKAHLTATPTDVLLLTAHNNLTADPPVPWTDEVRRMRKMITALTTQVTAATAIDERLRTVLLKLLAHAQFAMAQYDLLGGSAMDDAIADIRWTFVAEQEVLVHHADNPLVEQTLDALAQTESLADRIKRSDPILRVIGGVALVLATLGAPSLAEPVKVKLNPAPAVQPALTAPSTIAPDGSEPPALPPPVVAGLLGTGEPSAA